MFNTIINILVAKELIQLAASLGLMALGVLLFVANEVVAAFSKSDKPSKNK